MVINCTILLKYSAHGINITCSYIFNNMYLQKCARYSSLQSFNHIFVVSTFANIQLYLPKQFMIIPQIIMIINKLLPSTVNLYICRYVHISTKKIILWFDCYI